MSRRNNKCSWHADNKRDDNESSSSNNVHVVFAVVVAVVVAVVKVLVIGRIWKIEHASVTLAVVQCGFLTSVCMNERCRFGISHFSPPLNNSWLEVSILSVSGGVDSFLSVCPSICYVSSTVDGQTKTKKTNSMMWVSITFSANATFCSTLSQHSKAVRLLFCLFHIARFLLQTCVFSDDLELEAALPWLNAIVSLQRSNHACIASALAFDTVVAYLYHACKQDCKQALNALGLLNCPALLLLYVFGAIIKSKIIEKHVDHSFYHQWGMAVSNPRTTFSTILSSKWTSSSRYIGCPNCFGMSQRSVIASVRRESVRTCVCVDCVTPFWPCHPRLKLERLDILIILYVDIGLVYHITVNPKNTTLDLVSISGLS